MFQRQKDSGNQPTNYVPGRGRGAVGFITRSDIGPAKVDIGIEQDDDQNDYNDAKYDEWNGYSIPLFNMGDYDDEDREADITYNTVDRKMEERRSKRIPNNLQEKPSIVNQFSDLKRELAKVGIDEWLSIPDIGDYSIKKKKQDKITPVPDSVIMSAQLSEKNLQTKAHDLNEIGEARGALLSLKLDKISDNVSGQSVVDKRGYLTSLASLPHLSENEIGDFKKARLLLKSVIQTDPKNSFGWIAAARIEELDGKLPAARSILAQGLQQAEDQEDIWIELSRLETPEKAKLILNKAIQTLPHSVKIWLNAVNKEQETQAKIKLLKRALEFIPNSVDIWKELVSLSSESEALVLLYKAVECIPKNLSLWLALAKLETYDNAKAILNRARQNLPQEPTIWINAAKLEESAGKDKQTIAIVLSKGIKILKKNQVKIVKEDWLQEAEISEKCSNINTCYAIIKALTLEEDKQSDNSWKQDFTQFEQRGSLHTARAIIAVEGERQNNFEIWKEFIEFERRHKDDDPQYFDQALELAVTNLPQIEQFWIELILRKQELKQNYLEIFEKSPKSENILLTLSKLEKQQGNYDKAYQYLQYIQENLIPSDKTWIKMFKLLLLMNKQIEQAEKILTQYPQSDKLWILCGQAKINQKDYQGARQIFEEAIKILNNSLNVWLTYIKMECQQQLYTRARPLIDRARDKNPKSSQLWAQAIRLEIDAKNHKAAQFLLSKALQCCQLDGELWSLAIELEPKTTRKKKSADAVTLCVDNPYVYLSTAKVFLNEGKIEKAKRWLEKALILEPRLGDAWAYLYLIEKEILSQCISRRPKYGRLWKQAKETLNQKYDIEKILIEASKLAQKDIAKLE